MKLIAKFSVFILLIINVVAQEITISGKVLDAKTGEPISFASVYAVKSKNYVPTNSDGTFKIKLKTLPDTLNFFFLGYEKVSKIITTNEYLIVKLQPKELTLEEVVIVPTKDPILMFMKRVIKNKKNLNPKNYKYYEYDSYNKIIMTLNDSVLVDTSINSYLYIWEVITHKIHIYPNKDYEKVLATRMAGLEDIAMPFSPTDLQSLSFYDNKINIMGNDYISPLSVSAFTHYKFIAMDTLLRENNDSIFIIKFVPKKEAENLLQGNMLISSADLALLSIKASAAKTPDNNLAPEFSIKQIYEKINNKWFTTQLIGNLEYKNFKVYADTTHKNTTYPFVKITSLLRNIIISDTLPKKAIKKIKTLGIEIDRKALKRDSSFWENYRPVSLTEREKNTYTFVDTAFQEAPGARRMLKFSLNQLQKLPYGLFQIGYFDLNLNHLLKYNEVEGTRLGLGVITNGKLSQVFNLGGYLAYGFKDKKIKYGGQLSLSPLNNKRYRLLLFYENDIKEIGNFYIHPVKRFTMFQEQWLGRPMENRDFYVSLMQYYQKYEGGFLLPIFKNADLFGGLTYWQFQDTSYKLFSGKFRWAIGQRTLKINMDNFVYSEGNPVMYANFLGDLQNYRMDFAISGYKDLSPTFQFGYTFRAGKIFGFKDELFFGHSVEANGDKSVIFSRNSFETLPYNKYIVKEYASGFFSIKKNNTKFPTVNYHPDLQVHFNVGIGNGAFTSYYDLNEPYTEVGLTIEHLLPKPFDSFGASVFLRANKYYYKGEEINNNIKIKLFISEFGKK